MNSICKFAAVLIVVVLFHTSAHAVTVPFTEDFTDSSENWVNFNSSSFLTHVASGGPDGGAYASGTLSFLGRTAGDAPVVLRGRHDFDASDDNFVGDWVGAGVRTLSVEVRHNAPVPLTYFFRGAGPINFPGGVALEFAPVPPNVWTELTFNIRSDNPQFVTFEGSDFASVFSDIGHVQFGVSVPASLVEDATTYTFDIDKVMLAVPEPESIASAAMALGFMVLPPLRRLARKNGTQLRRKA
jgi:hypothetical protein